MKLLSLLAFLLISLSGCSVGIDGFGIPKDVLLDRDYCLANFVGLTRDICRLSITLQELQKLNYLLTLQNRRLQEKIHFP